MPFLRSLLAAVAFFSTLAGAHGQRVGTFYSHVIARSDAEMLFAYFYNGKTGVYKFDLTTAAITPFLPPKRASSGG
ncbi:hypothetical protein GCM10027511_33810 [Hymenobacter humi]